MKSKAVRGLCLLALAFAAGRTAAQSVRITSPSAGDTLYRGDTITVHLEWDSLFEEKAPGMVVFFSHDAGVSKTEMVPVQMADKGIGSISFLEEWAHEPRFVLPAEVPDGAIVDADSAMTEVVFIVEAYGNANLRGATECCIMIAKTRPVPPDTSGTDTTDTLARALRIITPSPGDILTAGDTITLTLAWDPVVPKKSRGILVSASADNGSTWYLLAPLQGAPNDPLIAFSKSWAAAPRFIIPDTLTNRFAASPGAPASMPAVSDRFMFQARAYYYEKYKTTTQCCITVRPRAINHGTLLLGTKSSADTISNCDTLRLSLWADSTFKAKSDAVIIEASAEGSARWFALYPVQFPSSPVIPFFAAWAAEPMFILPDTLFAGSDTTVHDVSMCFRARSYRGTSKAADSLFLFVRHDCSQKNNVQNDSTGDDGERGGGPCGSQSGLALLVPIAVKLARRYGKKRAHAS